MTFKWVMQTAAVAGVVLFALLLWASVRVASFPMAASYLAGDRLLFAGHTMSFGNVKHGWEGTLVFRRRTHPDNPSGFWERGLPAPAR